MKKHGSGSPLMRRNALTASLFLLPSFLFLAAFVFWPMIYSVVLSLYEWNPLKDPVFVGGANYTALMQDDLWWTSLKQTLYYIVLNVPVIVLCSVGLALLVVSLGKRLPRLANFFKGLFFIPTMMSLVATAIVWLWLLSTNYGALNSLLGSFGIQAVEWLSNTKMSMISIVIVTVWRWAGYYMVIFIAGLQSIPPHYYEAAEIDGASAWRKFLHITLPQLYPTIFFVALMSIIGSFQEFDLFYMLTLGGPRTSTYVTGFYMWKTGFSNLKMGYASAMSTVLFVIMLIFTVIQLRINNKKEVA
ncbi:sugar ABC transporter permease [Ruminococcaceae bacterium OttesenSCG-928-A11]|nr:sugar ABC transporter permease [Ruminococcaceae bacterium OttesenSCG-928-A11]